MLHFIGNLGHALATALAGWRRRRQAYAELYALDDRSLADIGIHRSQISALVESLHAPAPVESTREGVTATAFGRGAPRLSTGRTWLPPI